MGKRIVNDMISRNLSNLGLWKPLRVQVQAAQHDGGIQCLIQNYLVHYEPLVRYSGFTDSNARSSIIDLNSLLNSNVAIQ